MGIKLDRKQLAAVLDDGARQLPPQVCARLSAARQSALQQQLQRQPLQAQLHHLVPAIAAPVRSHPAGWGSALLLALLLLAALWQWHAVESHDHGALDLAILTDDLPVEMYVDRE